MPMSAMRHAASGMRGGAPRAPRDVALLAGEIRSLRDNMAGRHGAEPHTDTMLPFVCTRLRPSPSRSGPHMNSKLSQMRHIACTRNGSHTWLACLCVADRTSHWRSLIHAHTRTQLVHFCAVRYTFSRAP